MDAASAAGLSDGLLLDAQRPADAQLKKLGDVLGGYQVQATGGTEMRVKDLLVE